MTVNGKTIDYIIDGKNRRVGKKINGTLIQGFLYQDRLNPIAELDQDNNVVSSFIYADKRMCRVTWKKMEILIDLSPTILVVLDSLLISAMAALFNN